MIDGHGDPNVSSAYREAVKALYTAEHAARRGQHVAPASVWPLAA